MLFTFNLQKISKYFCLLFIRADALLDLEIVLFKAMMFYTLVDSRYIFNVASYLLNQLQTPTRVLELIAND